jgi:hypothetical protein
MQNNFYVGAAIVLVAALAVGAYFFPSFSATPQTAGSSTAGNTFSNAKIAQVTMIPSAAGTNATTSSMLNSDENDRIIIDGGVACTGIGTFTNSPAGQGNLANWTVKAATTSTAAPADVGALTNFNLNINVATTTPTNFVATSTNPVTGNSGRIWAAGTYETFWWNATSTATCQPYVHYIPT